MTVLAHRPREREPGHEPGRAAALLRALVTVVLVTAVVAAGLGTATWVASRALVSLLR